MMQGMNLINKWRIPRDTLARYAVVCNVYCPDSPLSRLLKCSRNSPLDLHSPPLFTCSFTLPTILTCSSLNSLPFFTCSCPFLGLFLSRVQVCSDGEEGLQKHSLSQLVACVVSHSLLLCAGSKMSPTADAVRSGAICLVHLLSVP